jgi:hypothetical protein
MPRTDRQLDTDPPDRSDERNRARERGQRSKAEEKPERTDEKKDGEQ